MFSPGPLLLTWLREQTWLCLYCWYQAPSGVVSPRRAITRAHDNAPLLPKYPKQRRYRPWKVLLEVYTLVQPHSQIGYIRYWNYPQMALHVTAHILLAQACHTGWQHCTAVLHSYCLVVIVVYKCRWNAFINKKESPLTIYVFSCQETFSNGCKLNGWP